MPPATEWLRRVSWTPADEAEFKARLSRARAAKRAQYLRIQAWHLARDADPPLPEAALALLDRLLREYPDGLHAAAAHQQRASCLAALGRGTEAIDALRRSLEAERVLPNVQVCACLDFAELVLALDRKDLFVEALSILSARSPDPFPLSRYRHATASALLSEQLGLCSAACAHANEALAAAAATKAPFRYHQKLGLVTAVNPDMQRRLRTLAESHG